MKTTTSLTIIFALLVFAGCVDDSSPDSMTDHDGTVHAGEYVWRHGGSVHDNVSEEGAIVLAVYRKPNLFQNSTGLNARKDAG